MLFSRVEFDATRAHDRSIGTQHSIIPIASRHSTSWRTYQHNKKLCRFGVVLEELDILATYVGYKHNQDPNVPIGTPAHHSLGVVTGRVDRVGEWIYSFVNNRYLGYLDIHIWV